jgi:hypothetical protein
MPLDFLAFLLLPFGLFALLGATIGGFIASVLHRDREMACVIAPTGEA